MSQLKYISLNHHQTPIEVREKIAFDKTQSNRFLLWIKEVAGVNEMILISTCNRTEIYYLSPHHSEEMINFICAFKGAKVEEMTSYFTSGEGDVAVKYLFEVSMGLESKILGDMQVINQIKNAYQSSVDLGVVGPMLHRLMHTIFYAHKRVVQETSLQDGNASVASVASDLVRNFAIQFESPRILLVGLGEIGQNVLDNLSDTPSVEISLLNKTEEKAHKIAEKHHYRSYPFSQLKKAIGEHDIIISAVTTDHPIIKTEHFDASHRVVIDLSVPRSTEQEVRNLPGVVLYNIDQLQEKVSRHLKNRKKAIPAVKEIIAESVHSFSNWQEEMEFSPTIKKLKSKLDSIRNEELAKYSKLNNKELALVEVVTKNMVQKLVKLHVVKMKAACKRNEAEELSKVLNELFDLEKHSVGNRN